jgi:hypothetical protein
MECSKKYWQLIIMTILFILGMFYYTRAYGQEFTYEYQGKIYTFEHPVAIKRIQMYDKCRIAYESCRTNAQFRQFHQENGDRCFKDAKEKCWWLPDVSDRDKAKFCFTNIGIVACPGDPKSKLIIALVTSLIQYGINCTDEWHYINNKLYWSQYHYEMMEFYDDLIRHGYP